MAQTKEGALRCAAGKIGITEDEYRAQISAGNKWCFDCSKWKTRHEFNADKTRFDKLSARCRPCQNDNGKRRYIPIPPHLRKLMGPAPFKQRDGDKIQARQIVNVAVKRKRMPNPNNVPCFECGDINSGLRHEYHHHKGYGSGFHLEVIALCSKCHHKEHPRKQPCQ